ncbi:MAG: hypothetical protein JXQ23_04380 [Clostridia bacterium]|nr:hypothetical protein [Clostridia bacterium]
MDKELLVQADDELEAYLIEAILKKNDIICEVIVIKTEEKKKFNSLPDRANIFVGKEQYDEALRLIEVIKKERQMKIENLPETKLYSKKQMAFAIGISAVFLIIVIWVVASTMR